MSMKSGAITLYIKKHFEKLKKMKKRLLRKYKKKETKNDQMHRYN